MDHPEQIQERLWNYIDGLGTAAERSAVENLISSQPAWQEAYEQLLELHQWLGTQTLEAPSMRFSKNVMEQIATCQVAPATRSYLNKRIIWGLGGFYVVVILGLVLFSLTQVNWTAAKGIDGYGIGQFTKKLDWSKYFSSSYVHVFMMLVVVVGLVLLDTILRLRTKSSHQQPG